VSAIVYDSTGPVSAGPSQDQIISAIYETVVQPQCYDRFSRYQLDDPGEPVAPTAAGCRSAPVASHFSFHFAKALETLKDQWVKKRCPDPAYVYEDGGGAWIVTNSAGRALRCSRQARRRVGVLPRDVLKTLEADSLPNLTAWDRFTDRLRSGRFTWEDFVVLQSKQQGLILLCRPLPAGSVVSEPALVMVEPLDVPMFPGAISYLARGFALNEQETQALSGLLTGGQTQLAEQQEGGKQLVTSTGAPGGAELLRLVALLLQEGASDLAIASGEKVPPSATLVCPDGARIQYLRLGAETGKSVIFMHGLLDCLAGVMRLQPQLRRMGFRVYVPLRNGYGESGPVPDRHGSLELFTEQIGALLEREGLQRPILLAHRGGIVFAHAVAKRWRSRIGGLVAVSPSGPLKTIRDFATLKGYQRVFAVCSSLARPLLPVLMRSWSRSIRKRGVELLLTRQSTAGSLDAAAVAKMNLAPLLRHSHDFAMQQGGSGFIADVDLVMRDWRPLVAGRAGRIPMVYLCGSEDPTAQAGRDASGMGQNIQFRVCEGADGTLLYTRPELILTALEDLANELDHSDGQEADSLLNT